jgi:hypothetical protein
MENITINSIPNEIYYQIISYLDYDNLLTMSKVDSRARVIAIEFINKDILFIYNEYEEYFSEYSNLIIPEYFNIIFKKKKDFGKMLLFYKSKGIWLNVQSKTLFS